MRESADRNCTIMVGRLVRSICICCAGSVSFDPATLGISLWSQRCYFRDVKRMTRLCAARLDEVVGRALGCERVPNPRRVPEEVLARLVLCFSSEFGIEMPDLAPEEGDDARNSARCSQMRFVIRGISRHLIGRSEATCSELRDWLDCGAPHC